MSRGAHSRTRDHFGDEEASYVVLDDPTYHYGPGQDLMTVLDDMDTRSSTMITLKGFGTATITSAATNVTVTHNAGYTPSAHDIHVVPTNTPTNDPGWYWISNITSTQFRINVRTAPGALTATFSWRVSRVAG